MPDRRTRITPNQIEVKCHECDTKLYYYPSELRQGAANHFCDRLCLGKWRSKQVDAAAAHWKGGTSTDRGRVKFHIPWHPRAQKDGYVYRYIIIAELKLGRTLTAEEVVHHDDENHTNDHPDNLIVYPTQADHARHHGKKRGNAHMRKG